MGSVDSEYTVFACVSSLAQVVVLIRLGFLNRWFPNGSAYLDAQHMMEGWKTTEYSGFYTGFWRRKWQPTPEFWPGESQGRRSLVGCHLWGPTELDTTEATWRQQHTGFLVLPLISFGWYHSLYHIFSFNLIFHLWPRQLILICGHLVYIKAF